VKDWWGADLPIMRGQNNFDTVRYEFYSRTAMSVSKASRRRTICSERVHGPHLGDAHDFPALKDGRVKTAVLPDDTPSAPGLVHQYAARQIQEPQLREALINAFDFEWTNKTIMYGAYKRTVSVFQDSNMMAEGKPSPTSSNCSSRSTARCDEVIRRALYAAVSDGTGQDARCAARFGKLLDQARISDQGRQGMDAKGEPSRSSFSSTSRRSSRIICRSSKISKSSASWRRCALSIRCSIASVWTSSIRHHGRALQLLHHAGRCAALLFHLAVGQDQRIAKSGRMADPAIDAAGRENPCQPKLGPRSRPLAARSTA